MQKRLVFEYGRMNFENKYECNHIFNMVHCPKCVLDGSIENKNLTVSECSTRLKSHSTQNDLHPLKLPTDHPI